MELKKFPIWSPMISKLFTFCDFYAGGYSVQGHIDSKTASGTLPSELGRLKNWQYIVFGKLIHTVMCDEE